MSAVAERPHLTVQAIARIYGVDQDSVRNWIRDGVPVKGRRVRLHAVKVGTLVRVPPESWERFLADCNPDGDVGGPAAAAENARERTAAHARVRKRLGRD